MAQSKVTPLVIFLSMLLAFCPAVPAGAVVDPGLLSIEDDVKAIKEKFQKQMEELRGDFSRQLEGRTQDFENRLSQIRAMAAEELDKTRAEARKQMELLQNRAAEELFSIGLQFEKQLEELKNLADEKLAKAQAEIERLTRENETLKQVVEDLKAMAAQMSAQKPNEPKAPEVIDTSAQDNRPRARMGMSVLPGDPTVAAWVGSAAELLTIVAEVSPGGSADRLGLKQGDVIIQVDGESASIETMRRIVMNKKEGDEITLIWARRGADGVMRTQVRGILASGGNVPAPVSAAVDNEMAEPAAQVSESTTADPEPPVANTPVTDTRGVSLGISVIQEDDFGIRVTEVDAGSNAAILGLIVGDVITGMGDARIRTIDGLRDILMRTMPGAPVELHFQRDGRAWIAKGTLAQASGDGAARDSLERASSVRGFLGIVPAEFEGGLIIDEVIEGSCAAEMGLTKGDRLVSVGGKTVSDLTSLRASLQDLRQGDSLKIGFSRDGEAMERRGTLGAFPEEQSSRTVQRVTEVARNLPAPVKQQRNRAPASTADKGDPVLGIAVVWSEAGVTIERVFPGSLAEEAGLELGDRLIRIESTAIDSLDSIQAALENREEYGVVFEVQRGLDQVVLMTRPREAIAIVEEKPTPVPAAASLELEETPILGLDIEENSWGILVTGTVEGMPAHEGGLRAGDWIMSICDSGVDTIEDVTTALQFQGLDTISVKVRRGIETLELSIPLLLP